MIRAASLCLVALVAAAQSSTAGVVGAAEDLVVRVTSPFANRLYQTRGLKPGVEVSIHERGPLASAVRARPEAYELCVDFSHPHGFTSCKGLAAATNLAAADLASFHEGAHVFRAYLRPHPAVVAADAEFAAAAAAAFAALPPRVPLLSEAELAGAAVNVPYATGPLRLRGQVQGDGGGSGSPALASVTGGVESGVEWVVAVHYSHDAHVAVLHWGTPVYVLELERYKKG